METLFEELKQYVQVNEENQLEVKQKKMPTIDPSLLEHFTSGLHELRKIDLNFNSEKYLVQNKYIYNLFIYFFIIS